MAEPTKKIYGPGLVARSVNERNLVEHIPRLGHGQDRHAVHSLMLASDRWFRVVRPGSFCAPVIEEDAPVVEAMTDSSFHSRCVPTSGRDQEAPCRQVWRLPTSRRTVAAARSMARIAAVCN